MTYPLIANFAAVRVDGDGIPRQGLLPPLGSRPRRPAAAMTKCFAVGGGDGGGGGENGKIWQPETVSLKDLNLSERWLQNQIRSNPGILGIGDVFARDHERVQPGGGRLDLLLETSDHGKRYEVELQLGATDPSHIIRVVEYWDLERRRYPQYSHCGVIIAEEITARFFNVISLLKNSGQMPLMALKLTAIRSPQNPAEPGLLFTRILGEPVPPDDAEFSAESDRGDWERKAGKAWMSIVDGFYAAARLPDKVFSLHYTNSYVSVRRNEVSVVFFYQRQKGVRAEVKLSAAPNLKAALEGKAIGFNLTSAEKYVAVTVLPDNVEQLAAIVGEQLKAAESGE